MMEVDNNNSQSNETQALKGSASEKEAKKSADSNGSSNVFINHAAIAWHENRRRWTGDQSRKTGKTPKDPLISGRGVEQSSVVSHRFSLFWDKTAPSFLWSMTYEDLLATNDSFPERIPLAEMVDFLVDIWHDEGLYD